MKTSTYTQKTLYVENPSKAVLSFLEKMRERKVATLEELHNKKDSYFPNKK